MRYYTLQAWFFKNKTENDNPHKLERLFILSTLHHHGGDSSNPSIRHVFNKQYFDKDWSSRNEFPLNKEFKISGFGRTYYVKQLDLFRCAWHDGIKSHTTKINDKLASVLTLDDRHLDKESIAKDELSQYSRLCICDSETNQEEIEIFSKILFGFLKLSKPEDIEENIPSKYLDGLLDLNFFGIEEYPAEFSHQETTQRRRNTLFMFMKIIDSMNPPSNQWRDTIMDAVYFKQNPITLDAIDFGRLEKIQQYWEVHQFLIYYVFCLESIIDILQTHLRKNVDGIRLEEFFSTLDNSEIEKQISKILGKQISVNSSIKELDSVVGTLIQEGHSSLKSFLNERKLMNLLLKTKNPEAKVGMILLLLILLQRRQSSLPKDILSHYIQTEYREITDQLNLQNVTEYFNISGSESIANYFQKLVEQTAKKHLFESSKRYRYGTKNWIFTEEEGVLYPSGRKLVSINDKNNRWNPIYNLLLDTEMIQSSEKVTLTQKGKTWLKMIE